MNWILRLFGIRPRARASLYGVRPEAMKADYPDPADVPPEVRIGKWVYLGYFLPPGLMPAPDATRYLGDVGRTDYLFQCVRDEGSLIVVCDRAAREYRVNPNRVIWVPTPRFSVGESVRATVGSRRTGWIAVRDWHRKLLRIYYLIEVERNGVRKVRSRRYWEDELESTAAPPD